MEKVHLPTFWASAGMTAGIAIVTAIALYIIVKKNEANQ